VTANARSAPIDWLGVSTVLRRARRPGPLVIISLAYLASATAIMIWRGISVSPDYILLLMVPVALLSGRFLGFLRDWIPFVVIFLGYEAMRDIAPKTGIAPHVTDIASWEHTFFGGNYPNAVLQAAFTGTLGRVLAYLATVVYFMHFAIPFGVGLVIWLVNRTQFLRYSVALMGMSFLAFFIFLLLPTAPPWYAENAGVIHGVTKLLDTTLPSYISPYYHLLNSNPVAAFPSLHAAYPLLSFFALLGVYRRAAWVLFGWSLLVGFSVIYLGEHWGIDVLAGWVFATLCWLAMMRFVVPHVGVLRGPAQRAAVPETRHAVA